VAGRTSAVQSCKAVYFVHDFGDVCCTAAAPGNVRNRLKHGSRERHSLASPCMQFREILAAFHEDRFENRKVTERTAEVRFRIVTVPLHQVYFFPQKLTSLTR